MKKSDCPYKEFHMEYSKYPDYCHYCGHSPKVLKK